MCTNNKNTYNEYREPFIDEIVVNSTYLSTFCVCVGGRTDPFNFVFTVIVQDTPNDVVDNNVWIYRAVCCVLQVYRGGCQAEDEDGALA